MQYGKHVIRFLLGICMTLSILPGMAVSAGAEESAYRWITDREEANGYHYASSSILADALNDIFDGNANIYHDAGFTKPVNTELGTSRVPNNGVDKFVGPYGENQTDVGTSCWIYANGVYFTLFGEGTGCGTAGENSQELDISGTENRNFSYENFIAWGVRPEPGALIRTRCGHSLIVLGYDADRIVILDGNGNGKGLVSIREMPWDRQNFRAKYIIQPNQDYFNMLYPAE